MRASSTIELDHPDHPCLAPWRALLGHHWRARLIAPRRLRIYREYEVTARRIIGNDAAGAPCLCVCDYRRFEPRSDDGETFYAALVHAESHLAWRLDDGRWLSLRRIAPQGEDGALLEQRALRAEMPR
ncbi:MULTISPECIES: hypothetical protein [Marichromatium]|uniref:Uncharacterized protein n=1 Tax=Marichromatium gracile TaxID=1048 RepID=A0A4R4ABX6_MARGR|nr:MULTISPECIES: hypothetical protein [Marichromatium]MBK1710684.1 hypothetical protein [Marichromatium gracile]MBO8086119.1 hypothetical protein [Marichromatium sp.]RNE88454.1 hypothetical protein EBL84_16220 [Marichromatium sp. AB31]TCW36324.1 hypothetical protein EDC29_104111 [Marichromatium gracile]